MGFLVLRWSNLQLWASRISLRRIENVRGKEWEFILCRPKTVQDCFGFCLSLVCQKLRAQCIYSKRLYVQLLGFFQMFFSLSFTLAARKYFSNVRWDSFGGFNNILGWYWDSIRELDLIFLPNHQPSFAYDMKMHICKTVCMCHQIYLSTCVGAKCITLFTAGVSYWFRVAVSVTDCPSSVVSWFQVRIVGVSR